MVRKVNRRMGGSVAPVLLGWNARLSPPLSERAAFEKKRPLASGNLSPRAMAYYSLLERTGVYDTEVVTGRVSGQRYFMSFDLVLLVSLRFSLKGYVIHCFVVHGKSILLVTTLVPN